MARPKKKSDVLSDFDAFDTFFKEFCKDNENLIEAYEEASNISFPSLECNIYKSLQDIDASNVRGVLMKSINRSLYYGSDVIEEIQGYSAQDGYSDKTTLQRYFEDVGYAYKKNNNNFDIKYCPENHDKLIEMNLKSVINIAKRYRGNRLSLEELISAGNEGLCVAFDKYNPNKQKLKTRLLEQIQESEGTMLTYNQIHDMFSPLLSYGNIRTLFNSSFHKGETYNKDDIYSWVDKNVKSAKFNSVAVMWINAYIIIELDNFSRLIKKPKKDIKLEREGKSPKEVYMDLSEPISEGGSTLGELLYIDDDTIDKYAVEEAQNTVRDAIQLLMTGVKLRNKRITFQRFGIGLPRPMSPKEISQRENISIARVSQIIQMTIDAMKKNFEIYKDRIDPQLLFDLLDGCENYV